MSKFILALFFLCAMPVLAQEIADPTRPLGHVAVASGVAEAGQGIQLTSILVGTNRKLAIINGQPVRELQTVKGAGVVVKKIDADGVTLQQGEKIWRVALNATTVRK